MPIRKGQNKMHHKLTQRDRREHRDLLAAMDASGIPESRLRYVYHYVMDGDVAEAVETYLEARHDDSEAASRGE